MTGGSADFIHIPVLEGIQVSAILYLPEAPRALYVLAHGAGAGIMHPFLEAMATRLIRHGIGTLRYQFPYMEASKGRGGRPDPQPMLLATVRAAVAAGHRAAEGVPLLAGGKSMGGRMTSLAAAAAPLPGVSGLVFLGFPLHPAGRPGVSRADHLRRVEIPMLFLQGSRDTLAELPLLRPVVEGLGERATLRVIEHADHMFHVLKRSGRTDGEVLDELALAVAAWREKRA